MLLRSDKRKKLLLLLTEGPKRIDEITEVLDAPATSVLPQVKKLKENGLVLQDGKTYKLSKIGLIVTEKMQPLVGTLEVFEDHFDYWTERDLTGIPPSLRVNLGKIGSCRLIEPKLSRIFEPPEEFVDNLLKSGEVMRFTSYFQPSFKSIHDIVIRNKAAVSLIVTSGFFERVVSDHPEELDKFLRPENSKLFIFNGSTTLASLTVTERFMALLLPDKRGKLDQRLLLSFEEKAIEWGKEMFLHLLDQSREVTGENLEELKK
nr:winged helix-turn-helix domain-containing protein [Methanosarcina sp. KYL-1]